MPPSLLGAAAAVLALVFWGMARRRPVVVLSSTDTSAIAALNRAQITATASEQQAESSPVDEEIPLDPDHEVLASLPPSGAPRERAVFLARLQAQLAGGDRPSRLLAMRTARLWGHPASLPLLRRGLRDCDPAVVREAALGLERFRGCSIASGAQLEAMAGVSRPRNVSRTL